MPDTGFTPTLSARDITLAAIVEHLLSASAYDAALDFNGDQVVDSADLVLAIDASDSGP
jgi:hypothetical protein